MPGAGLPTRSELEGWTDAINHLASSAETYGAAAENLEVATDAHVQQLTAPGSSEWAGHAADDAQEVGYADRGAVWEAADLIRGMKKVAIAGASDIGRAQNLALDAIAEAEAEDFLVSEDLTVTDSRRYTSSETSLHAARATQAEQFHSYITMRAATVASEDTNVGEQLQTAGSALAAMIPARWAATNEQPASRMFGKGVHPKETPGATDDEDYSPPADEVAAWYADWTDLQREAITHNATVAAHLRARPPQTNTAAIIAWNARSAELAANSRSIYAKQQQLAADAVQLGIPEPTVIPPQTVDDEAQVPQGGAVPSGLISVTPTTGKATPT